VIGAGLGKQNPLRMGVLLVLLSALLVGGLGCHPRSRTAERLAEDSAVAREIENDLTFNNITLEQANEQGQTLWRVKSQQALYSQDKQVAQVLNPDGEMFENGKPIFRVTARRGEVRQGGEKIILRGQIVITDLRREFVLRGDQLDWTPKAGLFIIRNHLRGTHPQLKFSATEARLLTKAKRLELSGQVVAIATNPSLQFQGEHLTWNINAGTIISDRPIKIDRLQGSQITDTARGNRATANLKTKVVTLTQNALLILADPPVQIASNTLVWNLERHTAVSDQPLTVLHRQQQVTMTANQGQMDTQKRIFYLNGNVQVIGQRNQAQLHSDRLTWNIPTQELVAEGNVDYRQANPQVTMRGPRAFGKLQAQTVVISGGGVVSEIVPAQR